MGGGVPAAAGRVFLRANRGLYAGKKIMFGNQISNDEGHRSRRSWQPNAQNAKLYSETLGRRIPLRVTAAALRNIDKMGGLDNYLLFTRDVKLDSSRGRELREEILLMQRYKKMVASAVAEAGEPAEEPRAEQ